MQCAELGIINVQSVSYCILLFTYFIHAGQAKSPWQINQYTSVYTHIPIMRGYFRDNKISIINSTLRNFHRPSMIQYSKGHYYDTYLVIQTPQLGLGFGLA